MKKVLSLILVLGLTLSVCACSAGAPTPDPTTLQTVATTAPAETEAPETVPTEPPSPVLIDMETITDEALDALLVEQGNRHGLNAFCFDNDWIYGAWSGENYAGEVAKVRYDHTDWTILDDDTNAWPAYCQAVVGDYLYYSQQTDTGLELVMIHSATLESQVVLENFLDPIQIVDGFIYYSTPETLLEDVLGVTEDSAHLYRCDLNGENREPVLETPVYYFSVFGDYVLYQHDKDELTLHIYDMVTGENIRLTDRYSYFPIFDGNYVYYLSDTGAAERFQNKLWRVTLDGSVNEELDLGCYIGGLLIRGDYIYYINKDDSRRVYRCLKDGSGIEAVTEDTNVLAIQWVGKSLTYMTTDQDGYVSGFFFCDPNGANKVEFRNSNDPWNLG